MKIRSKQSGVLAALFAASVALAGCNTVKGLGEDVQSVGRAGERVIN